MSLPQPSVVRWIVSTLFLLSSVPANANDPTDVLRQENLVAWCIVPFDAKHRGPPQRAQMLKDLGIVRCAYDWRAEHVPTFEQEILEYKKHGIEFFAFWSHHEAAFDLFEKHDLHPQIWQTLADPGGAADADKVGLAAQKLIPLVERTERLGSKLGLYNHGGWGGEPRNLVAVCQRLHQLGHKHVGIVYNFHHGHGHINDWAEVFLQIKPYLICLNLNGMNPKGQPKILGIGKGAHELSMIRTVVESGYDGPIGILDHRNELDARESLQENLDGLRWVRQELREAGSGGPRPQAAANPDRGSTSVLYPGDDAYRKPPVTVECRATLDRRDQYNILVASDTKQSSDHWELFSMNGNGCLTAYLPGKHPDHVHTKAMICDRQPHAIAMQYEPNRVRLYVDGRQVADQAIESTDRGNPIPGGLGIGRLAQPGPTCAGKIHWLRISKGVRAISPVPTTTVQRDQTTVGFWEFGKSSQPGNGTHSNAATPTAVGLAKRPYDPKRVEQRVIEARTRGDAVRGAMVFADAKHGCLACHQIGTLGGSVGPALSHIAAQRTDHQLVESVLWPQRAIQPEYQTWNALTVEGKILRGYKHLETEDRLTLLDPASGNRIVIDRDEIDHLAPSGSVMPDGLAAAMDDQQQADLFCFLSQLGRDDSPIDRRVLEALTRAQNHTPQEFPVTRKPLQPNNYRNWQHAVNRDRLYDFYTKQAEHFRQQPHLPMLLAPFPGLDGGGQGHWGNQNEAGWASDDWNRAERGVVQAGVFRGGGVTVARGVCVRFGKDHALSVCFNPDTLTYDALWSGGFVRYDSVRHGFVGGLRMEGKPLPRPQQPVVNKPFQYRGFYRHGNRVVFAYQVDGVDFLDAPWIHEGQFVRERAPVESHSMRHVLQGGPALWPQPIETQWTRGEGQPFAIDSIELPHDNPWRIPIDCGGLDFLPDGSVLVCTMQGDVWRVSGLDSTDPTSNRVRWRRFASGLHHALGLVVADGQVYVQCRDQLARLTDLNGDGEADFYECFSNAFETSPAGHDYICGLQRDDAGNFYTASGNQGLVRISADGRRADIVATGFRNPDGLGLIDGTTVTVPVSEGSWTPASMIHAVDLNSDDADREPPYFGYGGPRNGKPPRLPWVYLPRGIDNSSGGQTEVPPQRFGPLAGQVLHFSFGAGTWFVVLRDEVQGQAQGAVVPMPGDFLSGVHRGRFHPTDGHLYVAGMTGWGSYTPRRGCLERVRLNHPSLQVPIGFHVHQNGVRVDFAQPIDPAVATDLGRQFAQCWNYRYSGAYGSPEFSTTHPGVAGHDPLAIRSAHVVREGRGLFLEIPDLQPVNQLHLRLHVNDDASPTANPVGSGHDLFVTVHKLDEPFTAFADYHAEDKIVAAHPLLTDLATNAVRVPNPFGEPIDDARKVELRTGKNLTFETGEIHVSRGEPIQLTLINPDVVPHNWVLVRPGALQRVGGLANALIAEPTAYARQYVPESKDVLVSTDIVAAGSQESVWFRAPAEPGRYPYLCTFPGHWMVMNGVMVVD
ncbi:Auracyanin-A precursor [Rosistilla carotiformis]|uniref:Auracyanin-A n=1 Tax=Rosistilla carotiformis TaxID=2528017 RepID=A0A518JTD3_9BACT|nr:DUF6797 domain-containing protein [Rosistilla carotiformis]QDV68803.1 Auracyanin-A precursor [Rosistilla carotiformis]